MYKSLLVAASIAVVSTSSIAQDVEFSLTNANSNFTHQLVTFYIDNGSAGLYTLGVLNSDQPQATFLKQDYDHGYDGTLIQVSSINRDGVYEKLCATFNLSKGKNYITFDEGNFSPANCING